MPLAAAPSRQRCPPALLPITHCSSVHADIAELELEYYPCVFVKKYSGRVPVRTLSSSIGAVSGAASLFTAAGGRVRAISLYDIAK